MKLIIRNGSRLFCDYGNKVLCKYLLVECYFMNS